jgi:hypothetical protein
VNHLKHSALTELLKPSRRARVIGPQPDATAEEALVQHALTDARAETVLNELEDI